jgi:hypothetical protein
MADVHVAKESKMLISELFPNRFVKAEDLEKDVPCFIEQVQLEDVYNPGTHENATHPILYVKGGKKGVLLNKTNARTISDEYGDETDTWKGKAIVLYSCEVSTPTGPQPAIRIKIPISVPKK